MSDFDKLLVQQLAELPPSEETVKQISPWQKAFHYIAWGYALSLITVPFCYLHIILPLVGALLLYLGFRILRGENRWFRACWCIAAVRLLYLPANMMYYASGNETADGVFFSVVFFIAIQFSQLLCFWKAMQELWSLRTGKPKNNPIMELIVIQVLMIAFLYMGINGLTVAFALCGLIAVLVALGQVGKQLEECGYELHVQPVHIASRLLGAVYLSMALLLVGMVCISESRVPMEYQPIGEITLSAEAQTAKEHLAELNTPAAVLDILSEEDLLALQDAEQVWNVSNDNSSAEFYAREVLFQLPEKRQCAVIYYEWRKRPLLNLREFLSFQYVKVAKDSRYVDSHDHYNPHGRAVCDLKGEAFYGDFTQGAKMMTADVQFSYPWMSQNWRGYVMVSYQYDPNYLGYTKIGMTWLHQANPFVIPYDQMTEQDTKRIYSQFVG